MKRQKLYKGDVVRLTTDAISSIEGKFMKRFYGKNLIVAREIADDDHNVEGYALFDTDKSIIKKGSDPFVFIAADLEKVSKKQTHERSKGWKK